MKAKLTTLRRSLTDFATDAVSSLICIAIGIWIVSQQISALGARPTYAR